MPRSSAPARRTVMRRVVTLVAAAGAIVALPTAGASAAPITAQPASAFRDSIGVQTHFPFQGYAYDRAPVSDIAAMLRSIGVAHLRDDTCFLDKEADCSRVRARIAELQGTFGAGGPKVDLLAIYARELAAVPDRAVRDADILRALTAVATPPLAGFVTALEPVNEPDLKESIDWEAAVLADDDTFQRLLARPDAAGLRSLTHLSPAIGHAKNTPLLLSRGWNSGKADVGNFHPYPPAWGGPEVALDTQCGTTDAIGCARMLGASASPWATEAGYTTSGSFLSTSHVSERAQAIYLPRILLENFRRGVARTYLYELIDLKPSTGAAVEGFGLWRSRAANGGYLPGSPKPAAIALSRLNAVIGDLGAGTAPASTLDVAVRISGAEVDENAVRRVLLRRADGSYVLALWQPKVVWRNAVFNQADLAVPDLATEVRIGGGAWNVTASRPQTSASATGSWPGVDRVTVPIGADVTLLDLRSTGGGEPGSPTPTVAPPTPEATPTPTPVSTPRPTPRPSWGQSAWAWLTSLFR